MRATYVLGKGETLPILLKRYNNLKKHTNKSEFKKIFNDYYVQIKQDIPRTFVNSKWFQNKENQNKIYEIFKCFFVYRKNIGYLQGQLFLLVPLLKAFENQIFLAFWSFVKIVDSLQTIYSPLIFKNSSLVNQRVEMVYDTWIQLRKFHIPDSTATMLKALVRWKFMSTMFFSIIGSNLNNMNILMDYFMKDINDEETILKKNSALSLALLLSFFHKTQITSEDVQLFSTCFLSENALITVIQCAHDVMFLFK